MSDQCECRICVRSRAFDRIVAGLPDPDRAFMEDFYSDLEHAETDRDWLRRQIAQWDGNPKGGDGTAPSQSDDSPVGEADAP